MLNFYVSFAFLQVKLAFQGHHSDCLIAFSDNKQGIASNAFYQFLQLQQKFHRLGDFDFFLIILESEKSKIKASADSRLSKGSLVNPRPSYSTFT